MERNRLTPEQAEGRLQAQMDIELKRSRANYVIDNSRDLAHAKQQVDVLWDRLGLL
ncbi:dephospho-CoA kinase [compost metagenome]